ncbi:MAG: hypothetical protein LC794_00475 [Acidobacteria bacterium]|nr:hypothetical protein [Acidobacteriota bacterium]
MRILVVSALFVVCAVNVVSQQPSTPTKTQAIAAAFNKHKNKVKEKYGVRTEKYKDVRSEPVVKPNIGDYAGAYEVADLGSLINIQVGSDGRVQATGSEKVPQSRTFNLENVRIEGALLTASKVYQDGTTEAFEGVFLKRTDRNNPTDPGVTTLGLGVVLRTPVEQNDLRHDKLFYQLKQ